MMMMMMMVWVLQPSPGRQGKQQRSAQPRRKRKKSVGDRCLIWLFWSLVIVHLWIYKFFFLILPVPIVCILIKKLGTAYRQTCINIRVAPDIISGPGPGGNPAKFSYPVAISGPGWI